MGSRIVYPVGAEERRPLCRQPDDHHFGSFIMLAVTAGALSAGHMGGYKNALFFLQESLIP